MRVGLFRKMREALYGLALPRYFQLLSEFKEKGHIELPTQDCFEILCSEEEREFTKDEIRLLDVLEKMQADIGHLASNSPVRLNINPKGFLSYHIGNPNIRYGGVQRADEIFFATFDEFLTMEISEEHIMPVARHVLGELKVFEKRIEEITSMTSELERFSYIGTRAVITEKTKKENSELIKGIFLEEDENGYAMMDGFYKKVIYKPGNARTREAMRPMPHAIIVPVPNYPHIQIPGHPQQHIPGYPQQAQQQYARNTI